MLASTITWFLFLVQGCPPPTDPIDCDYDPELLPARGVNLVLNGDFQHLSEHGTIDENTLEPADGAFWNGAEGLTHAGAAGTRVLRFNPKGFEEFIYQRVGADHLLMGSLGDLIASVQLAQPNDEIMITLSEGNRFSASHDTNFPIDIDHSVAPPQPVFPETWLRPKERFNGQTYDLVHQPVPSPKDSPAFISANGTDTKLTETVVAIDDGVSVFLEWDVPEATGTVRFCARPRLAPVSIDTKAVVELQVWRGPGSPYTTVDSWDVVTSTGAVVMERVKIDEAGSNPVQRMRIILRHQDPTSTVPTQVRINPLFVLEGRGLTYSFGTNPAPRPDVCVPDCTTGVEEHRFIQSPVPGTGWHHGQVMPVKSGWLSFFGDLPTPPLDIRIGVDGTNKSFVAVDNVSLLTPFSNRTPVQLRDEILAELRDRRNAQRLRIDRDDPSSSHAQGKIGPKGSPYQIHRMRLSSGTSNIEGGCWSNDASTPPSTPPTPSDDAYFGEGPEYVNLALASEYEDVSFKDSVYIAEQSIRRRNGIGILEYSYDCKTDKFAPKTLGEGSVFSGINSDLARYAASGDASYLDAAYDLCAVAMASGITHAGVPFPPLPEGTLIHLRGYDLSTGINSGAAEVMFFERMHMPSAALRVYAACRAFNEAHTHLAQERYSSTELANWLTTLDHAVETARQLHVDVINPAALNSCNWGGSWQRLQGALNDRYGYHAGHALSAFEALSISKHPTWTEPILSDIRDNLVSTGTDCLGGNQNKDIVNSGASKLFPTWVQATERGGYNAGDEPRGWERFVDLVEHPELLSPGNDPDAYREQLITAVFHTIRFQTGSGQWTSGSNDAFHVKDLSGNHGGPLRPPAEFVEGIAFALRLLDPSDPRYADLVAIASSHLEVTRDHFKRCFEYTAELNSSNDDKKAVPAAKRFMAGMAMIAGEITADLMEQGVFKAGPIARVYPKSIAQAPSGGQGKTFTFTITLPRSSQAKALEAINERVKIRRWFSAAVNPTKRAHWRSEVFWPDQAQLFTGPVLLQDANTGEWTASLFLNNGDTAGAGDFKYTIRAWDANGKWSRATTYQEW